MSRPTSTTWAPSSTSTRSGPAGCGSASTRWAAPARATGRRSPSAPGGRSWPASTGVGKTLVSSAIIDRVAGDLGRRLVEVPVGFKWFVEGLLDGSLGFGGEESAGASFLRRDGTPWSTDKDGLIPCLLAAEM